MSFRNNYVLKFFNFSTSINDSNKTSSTNQIESKWWNDDSFKSYCKEKLYWKKIYFSMKWFKSADSIPSLSLFLDLWKRFYLKFGLQCFCNLYLKFCFMNFLYSYVYSVILDLRNVVTYFLADNDNDGVNLCDPNS